MKEEMLEIVDEFLENPFSYFRETMGRDTMRIYALSISVLKDLYNYEKGKHEELEKENKELKEEINSLNIDLGETYNYNNDYIEAQKEIAILQKENKELKVFIEAINELKRTKRPILELVHEMQKFEDEFISKSKIEDKIKELEETKLCGGKIHQAVVETEIRILKSLLEG